MKNYAKYIRVGGDLRQWVLLAVLAALYLGTFIPLFPYMGGAIGIFQNLLVLVGGWILGYFWGSVFGVAFSMATIPFWTATMGFSMASNVSSFLLSPPVACASAWIHQVWRNTREQYAALQKAHRDLASAREKLGHSEKLAFLGEMAAGIAHEINQPLSIISMSAEAALMDLERGKSKDIVADLNKIVTETQRAGQIIFRMKSLGRRAPAEQRLPTSINDVVQATLGLFQNTFQTEGISLRTELCPDSPFVVCHAVQIEQVFTNILMNAKDALREAQKRDLLIRTFRRDSMAGTEISDSGPGIPPEVLPNIFEPFFSTKEIGKGSGLGLSISYRIVQEHGGEIEVESEIGSGTCFRILLPTA